MQGGEKIARGQRRLELGAGFLEPLRAKSYPGVNRRLLVPGPVPLPPPKGEAVQRFDPEKLDVYQAAVEFVALADDVVENLPRGRAYTRLAETCCCGSCPC